MRSGPPSRRRSHSTKFLGVFHVYKINGKIANFTVEMDDFMKDAAAIYANELGATKLAEARTPYVPYLGLRTEGKRTSRRAVSYVLFALDEAASPRVLAAPTSR